MDMKDYAARELSCRGTLENSKNTSGKYHFETVAALNRLGDIIKYSGRRAEFLAEKLNYYTPVIFSEAVLHPEIAVELNQLSMEYRIDGEFAIAEKLLRQALEIETRAYQSDHPKLPHRMNNLTAILLLQGKLKEAEKLNHSAWALKIGRHDITSERILYIRIILCLLTGKLPNHPIGQLKTLFKTGMPDAPCNIMRIWNFYDSLSFFRSKISEEKYHFLLAVIDAHNNRNPIEAIGNCFPLWSNQPEVPLDEPWEE